MKVGIGFNVIGLLIVVAILGIASAVAVSTLGGKTGGLNAGATGGTTTVTTGGVTVGIPAQSAIAACEADASTVEAAVGEYDAEHGTSSAVTPALLTSGPSPYLQSFPSSADYSISIVSGKVMIAAPKTAAPVAYGATDACAKAGP